MKYQYGIYPSGRVDNAIWVLGDEIIIYGGRGMPNYVDEGDLGDMWAYSITENHMMWKMEGGIEGIDTIGIYVDKNEYSVGVPSSRSGMCFWKVSNSLFVFGGYNKYGMNDDVYLNDLWEIPKEIDSVNDSYEWKCAWISGSSPRTVEHGSVVSKSYHSNNNPSGRYFAGYFQLTNIVDSDEVVVIFGGRGYSNNPMNQYLGHQNDLWVWSHKRKQWRFVMGSMEINDDGIYQQNNVFLSYPVSTYRPLISSTSSSVIFFSNYRFNLGSIYDRYSDVWKMNKIQFVQNIDTNYFWYYFMVSSLIIVGIFSFGLCCLGVIIIFLIVFFIYQKTIKKENLGKDEFPLNERELIGKFVDSEVQMIAYEEIKLIEVIGTGGSDCTIYKSDWKSQIVAIKEFKASLYSNDVDHEDFKRELSVISNLHHPNVIQFFGVCINKPPKVGIVLEYCENGDLRSFVLLSLKKGNLILPKEKMRIMFEIASAMEYLHDRNIIHRDLKCSNVLLITQLKAKIIDFGLSRMIKGEERDKTRRIGTSYYMSPEILSVGDYTNKVDVFSFGVMLFEVMEDNMQPYGNTSTHDHAIELKVANNPEFRPTFKDEKKHPENVVDLAKRCWKHSHLERPSFKEIKKVLQVRKSLIEENKEL